MKIGDKIEAIDDPGGWRGVITDIGWGAGLKGVGHDTDGRAIRVSGPVSAFRECSRLNIAIRPGKPEPALKPWPQPSKPVWAK